MQTFVALWIFLVLKINPLTPKTLRKNLDTLNNFKIIILEIKTISMKVFSKIVLLQVLQYFRLLFTAAWNRYILYILLHNFLYTFWVVRLRISYYLHIGLQNNFNIRFVKIYLSTVSLSLTHIRHKYFYK